LYLAVIMDLYSRAIIGWSMGKRMTQQLMCDAQRTSDRTQGRVHAQENED